MKTLRKMKKGFTIVELVIVIAVIAILTAILVPTFISISNKADKASDTSLVTNLNTALKMAEGDNEIYEDHRLSDTNECMNDAVLDLKAYGFNIDQLATKSDQKLLYSLRENRFYLSDNEEIATKYPTAAEKVQYLWAVQNSITGNEIYSVYAGPGWTQTNITGLNVGFDAGSRTNIQSISYQNSTTQKVIIRTTGGDLTIDAPHGEVKHIGLADIVDIKEIASSSYSEKGTVSLAKIKTGRIVVTEKALLSGIHVVETNGNYSNIKVALVANAKLPDISRDDVSMNDGDKKLVLEVQSLATETAVDTDPEYIWISQTAGAVTTDVASSATVLDDSTKIPAAEQSAAAKTTAAEVVHGLTEQEVIEKEEVAARYAGGEGTEAKPYLLATKSHFASMDADVNSNVTSGKYYKVLKDINLGKIYPIGSLGLDAGSAGTSSSGYTITYTTAFRGNFDGAGHALTYILDADDGLSSGSNVLGLFGSIVDSTIKDVNLRATVSCARGQVWVGGFAGFGFNCNLENITLTGSVQGSHDVGGLFGYYGTDASEPGYTDSTYFRNVTVNAPVVCNSKRTGSSAYAIAGGFIGQLAFDDHDHVLTLENCKYNGSITVSNSTAAFSTASFFVGFVSDNACAKGYSISINFNNCTVSSSAKVTSQFGDKRTVGSNQVYTTYSAEAVAVCPVIKYIGCTSNTTGANPAKVSANQVRVDGTLQDLSLYYIH